MAGQDAKIGDSKTLQTHKEAHHHHHHEKKEEITPEPH